MKILVTGGAGYIGSHTVIELIEEGHSVTVVDNLSNSCEAVLERVRRILLPRHPDLREIPFYKVDIRDREGLERVFRENTDESGKSFDCCIHFAGLKAVGESVVSPWEYYDNNVGGTLVLTDVMRRHGCRNILFSSSATVYGDPAAVPITEESPLGKCTNPYGQTKAMLEQILSDLRAADLLTGAPDPWNVVVLRYFNPIGAHPSGLIGEDPNGVPNNLMPYITQVAVGKREYLSVFGGDYDTPDGTGVRDYIHVADLARGHTAALRAIESGGWHVYNLGTGRGYSVLEIVHAFEKASGLRIPYRIVGRRPGDIAVSYSDPSKARRELGWSARYGIEDMCRDAWNWQKNNPNGYGT